MTPSVLALRKPFIAFNIEAGVTEPFTVWAASCTSLADAQATSAAAVTGADGLIAFISFVIVVITGALAPASISDSIEMRPFASDPSELRTWEVRIADTIATFTLRLSCLMAVIAWITVFGSTLRAMHWTFASASLAMDG